MFVVRAEWMTLLPGREYFIILCTDGLILLEQSQQKHPDLKTVDVFGRVVLKEGL